MKKLLILFSLLFLFLAVASGQAPAAAPAPAGPTNLTAILEKGGRFGIFIRLLQSTKVGDTIYKQLNDSNQGVTVFAPDDASFSNLKTGMLNSLTDEQKVELIQFHVLPSYYSTSQFQTTSNPLHTQAGGSDWQFPMNVTTIGNSINITTGETNASVSGTVYTDGQLAVYQVDKVLLPRSFFVRPPPPPPPPPPKKADGPVRSPAVSAPVNASGENCLPKLMLHVVAYFMVFLAVLHR